MNEEPQNWEKEFDEKWHGEWLSVNGICRVRDLYAIKSFIAHEIAKSREEGATAILEEVRSAFLERGKLRGIDTILWNAPEIVTVMDKILSSHKGESAE